MGLPWVSLLFMGLGTTAFTLWVSKQSRCKSIDHLRCNAENAFYKIVSTSS